MKSGLLIAFFLVVLALVSSPSDAEMTSTNYRIPTMVISGGSGPMGSANFQTNSTAGQPSPLMDQSEPPFSDNYDLYPGFWYTLSVGPLSCEDIFSFAQAFGSTNLDDEYNISCDSEPDGDIDGIDLIYFQQGY